MRTDNMGMSINMFIVLSKYGQTNISPGWSVVLPENWSSTTYLLEALSCYIVYGKLNNYKNGTLTLLIARIFGFQMGCAIFTFIIWLASICRWYLWRATSIHRYSLWNSASSDVTVSCEIMKEHIQRYLRIPHSIWLELFCVLSVKSSWCRHPAGGWNIKRESCIN